jgi:hypothetical protein
MTFEKLILASSRILNTQHPSVRKSTPAAVLREVKLPSESPKQVHIFVSFQRQLIASSNSPSPRALPLPAESNPAAPLED